MMKGSLANPPTKSYVYDGWLRSRPSPEQNMTFEVGIPRKDAFLLKIFYFSKVKTNPYYTLPGWARLSEKFYICAMNQATPDCETVIRSFHYLLQKGKTIVICFAGTRHRLHVVTETALRDKNYQPLRLVSRTVTDSTIYILHYSFCRPYNNFNLYSITLT